MAKEAVLQVRIDADLKREAEELYSKLGTSLAEAVRMFARQSVKEQALPLRIYEPVKRGTMPIGIADGKYIIPDDLDTHKDEIASMFGVE